LTSEYDDAELSEGILAYFQRGQAASPRADEEAVRAFAGSWSADELVAAVKGLVEESLNIPIDWQETSLADAGRKVTAEMLRRHPQTSPDAFGWNFTFTWR